jgi:hypothetical protein
MLHVSCNSAVTGGRETSRVSEVDDAAGLHFDVRSGRNTLARNVKRLLNEQCIVDISDSSGHETEDLLEVRLWIRESGEEHVVQGLSRIASQKFPIVLDAKRRSVDTRQPNSIIGNYVSEL